VATAKKGSTEPILIKDLFEETTLADPSFALDKHQRRRV
jgi:hypothetical protein